jgi:hypothetical protein
LKDHLKKNWKKYLFTAAMLGAGYYGGEPGKAALVELVKVLGLG